MRLNLTYEDLPSINSNNTRYRTVVALLWLYKFSFAKTEVLQAVSRVHPENRAFLHRLRNAGHIDRKNIPPVLNKSYVWHLTKQGMSEICNLFSTEPYRLPRTHQTIVHDLTAQICLLNERATVNITDIMSPREMPDDLLHVPDIIYTNSAGATVALETELTRKANLRTYAIFIAHLRNIHNLKRYDHLKYYLANKLLIGRYRRMWENPHWTVPVRNPETRKLEAKRKKWQRGPAPGKWDACVSWKSVPPIKNFF